jgi:hypothetical protein
MLNKIFYYLTFSIAILSIYACAPSLGSGLKLVPPEPLKNSELGADSAEVVFIPVKIEVDTDNRKTTFVGMINDRGLLPEGDYNEPLQLLVENKFKKIGLTVSSVATTVIKCKILDLYVDVISSFPMSSAKSRASVEMTILDELTGKKYITSYEGSAETKNPFLTELTVQNTLYNALDSALSAAVEDTNFRQAIGL